MALCEFVYSIRSGLLTFVHSWYCEIPNGTLRAYAFLDSKMSERDKITSFFRGYLHACCFFRSYIDTTATGQYALIQAGLRSHLFGMRQDRKVVELVYNLEADANTAFGAVFASRGHAVLFGSVEGCVLVWDQKKGSVVYGLDHGKGMV